MVSREINFTMFLGNCNFCDHIEAHEHSYREMVSLFRAQPSVKQEWVFRDFQRVRQNYWDWNSKVISIIAYYRWIASQREMDERAGIREG